MLSFIVFVSIHRRSSHFRLLQSCCTASSLHAIPPALLTSCLERPTAQAGHPEAPCFLRGAGSAFWFSPRLDLRCQQSHSAFGSRLFLGTQSRPIIIQLSPLESALAGRPITAHSKGFREQLKSFRMRSYAKTPGGGAVIVNHVTVNQRSRRNVAVDADDILYILWSGTVGPRVPNFRVNCEPCLRT